MRDIHTYDIERTATRAVWGEELVDIVFNTEGIVPAKRYASWRDAICDVYVNVEVDATKPEEYKGFIRESQFGDVVLTDILLSEQRINRNRQHIARLDKDCYYLHFLQYGSVNVLQHGSTLHSNAARGAIFSATEQYELQVVGEGRAFYLEVPRDQLASRLPRNAIPVSAEINTTQGLGRIAAEFCASLAMESENVKGELRSGLGSQLIDIIALALMAGESDFPALDGSVQRARLRSVQQWIEQHLGEPDLRLERIAHANNMSLRYLHMLFRQCDMSVSDWIWHRRLQRSYDLIARRDGRSITSIAFEHGFNSSSHFSTLFRRKYGIRPRDLSRSD
nr:helix-turn-helix domain-containing protein [Flavimaribacter sediminis]